MTSPRNRPARLANEAWEALLSAHTTLIRQFAAEDLWHEISMREYDVLYTLAKCPEPIRLSDLNDHVLLSQPALSRLVERLATRGLIERQTDPTDGRGVRLRLTEAGRDRQRQIGERHARSVARAVGTKLSADELESLRTICGKLARTPVAGPPTNDEDAGT